MMWGCCPGSLSYIQKIKKMKFKFMTRTGLFAVIAVSTATAPAAAQEHQKAHIGLVYPLSTNGTNAANVSNTISLHALLGLSGGEDGVALSGLSTIIKGDQHGAVLSGLSNTISGDARGIQAAGLINTIGGATSGATVAGLVNAAGPVNGVQAAGLANVSSGTAVIQVAGLSNVSRSSNVQIAGVANASRSERGAQLAGLINIAGNANAQVAGLINIARKAKGVQVAGLINIAAESNCPLGIINIIKNGERQIGLSMDEAGNAVLALRSGGKYTYGIIGVGYNMKMANAPYVMEAGFGLRVPISKMLRLGLELSNTANTDLWRHAYYRSSFRPLLGLRFAKRLEIVAGPSFNYVNYLNDQEPYRENAIFRFYGARSTNGLFFGGIAALHINI